MKTDPETIEKAWDRFMEWPMFPFLPVKRTGDKAPKSERGLECGTMLYGDVELRIYRAGVHQFNSRLLKHLESQKKYYVYATWKDLQDDGWRVD